MSNAYKDWVWNKTQDVMLERGFVDKITAVEPDDPALGAPHHIWGIKNGAPVCYYVNYDLETEQLCTHQEIDI